MQLPSGVKRTDEKRKTRLVIFHVPTQQIITVLFFFPFIIIIIKKENIDC
jgi:hypothetical protein